MTTQAYIIPSERIFFNIDFNVVLLFCALQFRLPFYQAVLSVGSSGVRSLLYVIIDTVSQGGRG